MQQKQYENLIFLCHASEDIDRVIEIYNELKLLGFNPWLDKKNLIPGQDWDKEIRRAIKSSKFIIIFFSKNSVSKRGFVQREFKLALDTLKEIPEDQIFIIPTRLDTCKIPDGFQKLQYCDLFQKEGLQKLIIAIHEELTDIKNGKFLDFRNRKLYKIINIKNRTWMAENFNLEVGDGSWYYENNSSIGTKYGRLYNLEAAISACPKGWHLPNEEEWKELALHFGGYWDKILDKNIGNARTAYESLVVGGKSGFNACLGGYRDLNGKYDELDAL